jgi:hypothetical protein
MNETVGSIEHARAVQAGAGAVAAISQLSAILV